MNDTFKASSLGVAEASKAIENTQRYVNISCINELSIVTLLMLDYYADESLKLIKNFNLNDIFYNGLIFKINFNYWRNWVVR